jgi:hypothetical protein
MKALSLRISPACKPTIGRLAPGLAALTAMAGIGYAFWCLLSVLQSWAAATPWASQIIQ